MRLEDILCTQRTDAPSMPGVAAVQKEEAPALPASWGSDTVTFSPEARAAQESGAKEKEKAKGEEEKSKTSEAFSAYMRQARGEESSGDSVEALEKKLKALQSKLAQVAQDKNMSGETKSSMLESLQAEIAQVSEQLAEAKMAATAEAKA